MGEMVQKKSFFSVRNVLRILSLLVLVIVFCPCFLVSCAGQTINVNVMTAVGGLESAGTTIVEPHPIMLLALLIPVALLVVLLLKKMASQKAALICIILAVVDFVLWLIFRTKVKAIAEETFCSFKTTAWFFINLAALVAIGLLSAIAMTYKANLNNSLVEVFSKVTNKNTKSVVESASENTIGSCPKCGAENAPGAKFCEKCGEPLKQVTETNSGDNIAAKLSQQTKKISTKTLLIAVVAIIVLIVVISVVKKSGTTIDLNKYASVTTEGYDGYGRAKVTVDWDAINAKYGNKVSYTSLAKRANDFVGIYGPIEAIEDNVKINADTKNNLSNGDEITLSWDVADDLEQYVKCKLKFKEFKYVVSGLTSVETFDPFSDITVSFEGIAPSGNVRYEYTGSDFSYYEFYCETPSGLKNGDEVTIKLSVGNIDSYIERNGRAPKDVSKTYIVSGLEEYVGSYSAIPEAYINELKEKSYNTILAYTARDYDSEITITPIEYEGYAMCTIKDNVPIYGNGNTLYLIYSSFLYYKDREPVKVYYPVEYDNIKKGTEISCGYEAGIQGSSNVFGYWIYSSGYTIPLDLYSRIQDRYSADYNIEFGGGFEKFANCKVVKSLDDLTSEFRESQYDIALRTIQSDIENSYSSDYVVEGLGLFGEYFLKAKDENTSYEDSNKHYVVYCATLSSKRKYFDPVTVYYPVEFNGIIKMPDDTFFTYLFKGVSGNAYINDSWFTSTEGYIDGDEMFKKLITACCDKYDYERTGSLILFGE